MLRFNWNNFRMRMETEAGCALMEQINDLLEQKEKRLTDNQPKHQPAGHEC